MNWHQTRQQVRLLRLVPSMGQRLHVHSPGDYIVTIETPVSSTGGKPFLTSIGSRQWHGRAGLPGYSPKLSIFAKTALTVYTNATANDTSFYFARIDSSQAGRTLTLDLFDIGDASGADKVNPEHPCATGCKRIPRRIPELSTDRTRRHRSARPTTRTELRPVRHRWSIAFAVRRTDRESEVHRFHPTYQCDEHRWHLVLDGVAVRRHINFGWHDDFFSNPSSDTTTWQIDDCGNPVKLLSQNATRSRRRRLPGGGLVKALIGMGGGAHPRIDVDAPRASASRMRRE